MKKAKSQQSTEKNGVHRSEMLDDDGGPLASALMDEDSVLQNSSPDVGAAANLSRKKAVPPEPTAKKQLVIKLKNGEHLNFYDHFSYLSFDWNIKSLCTCVY